MKKDTVKAIFTNLLFVIGVILLVIGFSRGVLTVTRLTVFGKYPLDYYTESRCNYTQELIDENGEVMPRNKIQCDESLEYERKLKLTEDIVNSITMLIAGAALTLSFKRFILK